VTQHDVYMAAMDWFEHLSRPPSEQRSPSKLRLLSRCATARSVDSSEAGSERHKRSFYGRRTGVRAGGGGGAWGGDRRCMCTPACSHHASLPSPLHCHELTGDVAAAVAVAVEHADAWHDGSDSLDTASTLQQPTAALRDSYAADADAGRATTSCWQRTPSLLQRRRAGSAGAHTPAAVRQQQSAADKEEAGVCRTQGSASGSNGREPNGAAVGSSTTSDAAAPRGPQPSVLPTPPSSQALGSKGTADGLAARWASSGSCEVLAEGVVQPVPSVAGVLLATGLC
jgi:hypothetical protein